MYNFQINAQVCIYCFSKSKRRSLCRIDSNYLWRQVEWTLRWPTANGLVSIIKTYLPWTPRRTSGRIVYKKIWHESEAYRNVGKRFDWSIGFKRHIVMAAPLSVTAPSCVQNVMNSSSRRSMVGRGVLMIETTMGWSPSSCVVRRPSRTTGPILTKFGM